MLKLRLTTAACCALAAVVMLLGFPLEGHARSASPRVLVPSAPSASIIWRSGLRLNSGVRTAAPATALRLGDRGDQPSRNRSDDDSTTGKR